MALSGDQDDDNHEYFKKDIFSEVEDFYITSYALMKEDFQRDFPSMVDTKSGEVITVIQNQPKDEAIKLLRIQLPKFTGDYKSWPYFHDLFNTLVHENKSLAGVQKLQYLKSHISGEPEHLLRHFQITGNNYESAWKVLTERYDNKRILVNSQLKTLLSQSSVSNETSQGVKGLLDNTAECLQALENLGLDISNWDPIIVYLTVQKLPQETHQLWEQGVSAKKELSKWKELKEFLEGRFRTLEAVSNKRAKPQVTRDFHAQPPGFVYFGKCCTTSAPE